MGIQKIKSKWVWSWGKKVGQIRSNKCCEKSKEIGNIIRFFTCFTRGIPFKAKSGGCKITSLEIYGNYSQKCQI